MNILNNIQPNQTNTTIQTNKTDDKPISNKKTDILDKMTDRFIKRDANDTVTVPRAIFKGYLCFTAGTALNYISSFLKGNKGAKIIGVISNLMVIAGTFNFVKPFLTSEKKENT